MGDLGSIERSYGSVHYVSNSSLASIRWHDFKQWGVDDPGGTSVIRDTRDKYKLRIDRVKSEFEHTRTADAVTDEFCDGLSSQCDGYY